MCILWSQVFASPHKLLTVGLRGLDELGHPTAGTFSISHIHGAKVKRTCMAGSMHAGSRQCTAAQVGMEISYICTHYK